MYGNIPYKSLIDSLSLPSTIGTAISAGGAFTVICSDSVLGDRSPESVVLRREWIRILTWSAGFYTIATVMIVCLQALYGSPSFRRILSKKIDLNPELRTKFKPWPSWDFMRYVVAYSAIAMAYCASALHLAATIFLIQVFAPYGPTLVSQIVLGMICVICVVLWTISITFERPRVGQRWRTQSVRLPLRSPEQTV